MIAVTLTDTVGNSSSVFTVLQVDNDPPTGNASPPRQEHGSAARSPAP
ncbi:hypothetical protein [Krasilnikovia sp. MM14-A1259]